MNKRQAVLSILDPDHQPPYVPAAFFLHFAPEFHTGQAAVDKHLEFFRYTNMDFVKIQFEHPFPPLPEFRRPADWAHVPLYHEDFFSEPIKVVEGLVKAAKQEALILMTLYSPFMIADQITSHQLLVDHIREDPQAVKKGIDILTESMLNFVRGCIRVGVDGFYVSTQGGEVERLGGSGLFEKVVKPSDLAIWEVITPATFFNILHVCDYAGTYQDYTPYLDYPGQVVNCSLHLANRTLTGEQVEQMFGRPFMGGLERLGILANGTPEQARQAAEQALTQAPGRFMLAADCTVPSTTPWENLKAAIAAAHQTQEK